MQSCVHAVRGWVTYMCSSVRHNNLKTFPILRLCMHYTFLSAHSVLCTCCVRRKISCRCLAGMQSAGHRLFLDDQRWGEYCQGDQGRDYHGWGDHGWCLAGKQTISCARTLSRYAFVSTELFYTVHNGPLSTKSCLKSSKLRPILNGQFCHAISKNICLNVFGSKQPWEILVFVIFKL